MISPQPRWAGGNDVEKFGSRQNDPEGGHHSIHLCTDSGCAAVLKTQAHPPELAPNPKMTLEELRLAAVAAPTRSMPLRRRMRLLRAVLPCLPRAIAHALASARRLDREFWTNFLNPSVSMELGGWRFDRIHDDHHDIVRGVLACLESVIRPRKMDNTGEVGVFR